MDSIVYNMNAILLDGRKQDRRSIAHTSAFFSGRPSRLNSTLTGMSASEQSSIGRAAVEAAVADILIQTEFLANKNPAQILKLVVEETLEGRGDRLKAFTIATLALNRDASFDAQNNSIVRVQAARLRQLLQKYYEGPGLEAPIRIELPRGSYKPIFTQNISAKSFVIPDEAEVETTTASPELARDRNETILSRERVWKPLWVALAMTFFVLALLGGVKVMNNSPRPNENSEFSKALLRPIVYVQAVDVPDRPATAAFTRQMADLIETGLSAFDNIVVRRPNLRQDGSYENNYNYLIFIKLKQVSAKEYEASFGLLHGRTGDIVWSQSFPFTALDDAGRQKDVANTVISLVGDVYGAVSSDAFRRLSLAKDAPSAYRCILKSFDYLKSRDVDQRPGVNQCLDGLVAENPDDARLLSLRAFVLVRGYLDATTDSQGVADLERASKLARRAYNLEPVRARAQFGMFLTRFYDRRFEEAFDAARKALETNPHSSIIAASVGAAYISRGDFAAGDALLEPLMKMESNAPGAFLAFVALSAYMRGDGETAWRVATRRGQDHNPIGLLMRILACQQRRDQDCVKTSAQHLKSEFPAFASNLLAALDRYAFSESIKTRIVNDLAAGGLLTNGAI